MSCDAVAVSAYLWLAAFSPNASLPADQSLLIRTAAVTPPRVSGEPLFRDIVKQAKALRSDVADYLKAGAKAQPTDPAWTLTDFDSFKSRIDGLAALDMKGHETLAARNLDGDLKCILRGISQDLPKRLGEVAEAKDARSRTAALKEMAYLLNDNVEVITAPPAPEV